ncbi:MAG: DUF559 domain-containing protein [Acidimicrobiales bacterium]|nr:DUF559 domain-containing protein [Acidimicrobiales bacterium]
MHAFSDLQLTRTALQRRLATGELTRVERGWYTRDQADTDEDRWLQHLAARTARYPDGRLAGQGAAALVGLDGFDPGSPPTIYRPPGTSGRGPGVRRLELIEDPVEVMGLNVCGVGELLLGLGAELVRRPGCRGAIRALDPVELVELAVEAALRRGLTDLDRLRDVVRASRPNRPGRGVLAQVLAERPDGAPPTESYLETRFAQVLRAAGLPQFDRQVELFDDRGEIGRVDFRRDHVIAELVGKQWHLDRFNADHARYARLTAAGYRLLPFTFDDVERRPEHVARTVDGALSLGPAPPRRRDPGRSSCRPG